MTGQESGRTGSIASDGTDDEPTADEYSVDRTWVNEVVGPSRRITDDRVRPAGHRGEEVTDALP